MLKILMYFYVYCMKQAITHQIMKSIKMWYAMKYNRIFLSNEKNYPEHVTLRASQTETSTMWYYSYMESEQIFHKKSWRTIRVKFFKS